MAKQKSVDTMTSKKIQALIDKHESTKVPHYQKYQRYYEGNNVTIQDKVPQAEPDNRKAVSIVRKAVNTIIGYMFPDIVYTYKEESEIIDILNSEQAQLKEADSASIALSKSPSYKIIWQDDNKVKYAVVDPEKIIVAWSTDLLPVMREVYYYFKNDIIDEKGEEEKVVTFWRYTPDIQQQYISINDEAFSIIKQVENPTEDIPIIEHVINREKRNVFYHVIDLIDMLDEIVSTNMANEIATIANAILAMYGKYLDDEMVDATTGETDRDKFLRGQIKIQDGLSKEAGEYIEWIVKTVQWEGIFGIFDRIYDLIYELLEIPNMSSDKFYSDVSGEAMKWRMTPFENKASMIEAYYKQGLIRQIEIMGQFPALKAINSAEVTIEFKRNLPTNTKEKIEEAINIMAIAGKEAAVEYLGIDILPNQKEILDKIATELKDEITNIFTTNVQEEPQIEND